MASQNPDDVILYLYTTYDSNSFDNISIISCPMILAHHKGFRIGDSFKLSIVVKLQIIEINFENSTEVAGDKIILLRPQMTKP